MIGPDVARRVFPVVEPTMTPGEAVIGEGTWGIWEVDGDLA
jgi:hypothetical protein